MSVRTQQAIESIQQAGKTGFSSMQLRSERLDPKEAAEVVRHLPSQDGFDGERVAQCLERLPADTGENIQVSKSAKNAVIAVSVPGSPRKAFEWVSDLQEKTTASGVKMNFGPHKTTDVKIFWGKPDVNTLIDLGGDDD